MFIKIRLPAFPMGRGASPAPTIAQMLLLSLGMMFLPFRVTPNLTLIIPMRLPTCLLIEPVPIVLMKVANRLPHRMTANWLRAGFWRFLPNMRQRNNRICW